MTYDKGVFRFESPEAYEALLKAHVIAPHDVSPADRETHDREVRMKIDGGIGRYLGMWEWATMGGGFRVHSNQKSKLREIGDKEKVVNPWEGCQR